HVEHNVIPGLIAESNRPERGQLLPRGSNGRGHAVPGQVPGRAGLAGRRHRHRRRPGRTRRVPDAGPGRLARGPGPATGGAAGRLGLSAVFAAVAVVSVLAAGSVALIRADEIDEARASGVEETRTGGGGVRSLLHDRRVMILFAATALFHLANAPVMPLVGLY